MAAREFRLPSGPCDYLLFVGGKAAGVIEAKKAGTTLSGIADQAARYLKDLPAHVARWADLLPFDYESTGAETFCTPVRLQEQSSQGDRFRPQAILRRHDHAARKQPSSFARGGRPIITAAEMPNR